METTSTKAFMWDDWYIVKNYGATQPPREKNEPGKETGWVLLEMRKGKIDREHVYFSWTKHRRMTMDTPIEKTKMPDRAIIPKKAAIAEKTKRTNRCRDPINQGLFTTIY